MEAAPLEVDMVLKTGTVGTALTMAMGKTHMRSKEPMLEADLRTEVEAVVVVVLEQLQPIPLCAIVTRVLRALTDRTCRADSVAATTSPVNMNDHHAIFDLTRQQRALKRMG